MTRRTSDEGAVDLQELGSEIDEKPHVGEAGAEIIDGDLKMEVTQRADGGGEALRIENVLQFGNLDHHLLRGQPALPDSPDHLVGLETGIKEGGGGEVKEQPAIGQVGDRGEMAVESGQFQVKEPGGSGGRREGRAGIIERQVRGKPQQSFEADGLALGQRDDGLEDAPEFPGTRKQILEGIASGRVHHLQEGGHDPAAFGGTLLMRSRMRPTLVAKLEPISDLEMKPRAPVRFTSRRSSPSSLEEKNTTG